MLRTLERYPKAINLLLAGTLVLTLARAITLPYLVIYLSSAFNLQVSDIGLVIGSSLILGSLLSLYGGFLVDRTASHRLILGCCALFTLGFVGAFTARQLWLFYLCLVLVNLAYAVLDIAIKAGFAQRLPVEQRSEAFSIKYTLTNIGYAVGPFLGAGLARLDISLPFLVSAALGAGFLAVHLCWGERQHNSAGSTQQRWPFGPWAGSCYGTTAWCASPWAACSARWSLASSRPISRSTWWSPCRPRPLTASSAPWWRPMRCW